MDLVGECRDEEHQASMPLVLKSRNSTRLIKCCQLWWLSILEKSPCYFISPSNLDEAEQGLKMAASLYLLLINRAFLNPKMLPTKSEISQKSVRSGCLLYFRLKNDVCLLWYLRIFHRKNYLDLHISKSGLCFKEAGASIFYIPWVF